MSDMAKFITVFLIILGMAGSIGTFGYIEAKDSARDSAGKADVAKKTADSLTLEMMRFQLRQEKAQYEMNNQVAKIAEAVGAEVVVDTTQPPALDSNVVDST